jgi:hypothetical protein
MARTCRNADTRADKGSRASSMIGAAPCLQRLNDWEPFVPNRGGFMKDASRLRVLTKRYEQILEQIETLIFDLQSLVQELEADIEIEETYTGVFASQLRYRRDNLLLAIAQLEGSRAPELH